MKALMWRAVVNGQAVQLSVPPTRLLLSLLREELELTGTKLSCGLGRCGACMVLVDGMAVNACLVMAYQCQNREITTIEGLASQELHPVQQAFMEEGGFQCGYCTPGMIMSVQALLGQHPEPTEEQILQGLSGNLCRCTGYGGILRAVGRCCNKMESPGQADETSSV
ncbi:(2Fe-2S)-binding protein [Paenibacillus daejeonensis]|uniref:(2Fe-2S)-binding protein n=1 Tax=Paenibacillus daejeonensis TaxID=135193 RepID=UPI000366827E|nr:(2Fe-2S)-binding protein [Paenibacillus daejeonensis]